jgi:hypothetical protein
LNERPKVAQADLARHHAIGDRRAGALITAEGLIDWWTPHQLDGDAVCYNLVDQTGGRIALQLDGVLTAVAASTVDDAPVVRSTLRSRDAHVIIEDHLADGNHGFGRGTIVRFIMAMQGPAAISANIVGGSRFQPPRRTYRGSDVVAWPTSDLGSAAVAVRGMHAYEPLVLQSGETHMVTISPVGEDQRVRREVYERHMTDVHRTWRQSIECSYAGPREHELRTWLRQLLLLTNPDTGAVARAFSTSLPTSLGGERQVDERLAYLDDNARFIRLCERIDRRDLVEATRDWLADALLQGSSQARGITGAAAPNEADLLLSGWRDHPPVRRSDRAADGLDLAAYANASMMLDAGRHHRSILACARFMAQHLEDPKSVDGGRWAGRLTAQKSVSSQRTASNAQRSPTPWVSSVIAVRAALEASATTERRRDPLSIEASDWLEASKGLSDWLRAYGCFGVDETAGWRRSETDDSSDAQLLRWIASSDLDKPFPELRDDAEYEPRIRTLNSVNQMLAQLDDHGLVHRHMPHADDGFAPGQGADVSASADMIIALCRLQRWDEANGRMETLCALLNGDSDSVGTVPSHLDPRSGAHLGNRPHAPALLSLCEAVLALAAGPR